jgi:hypothetical protein
MASCKGRLVGWQRLSLERNSHGSYSDSDFISKSIYAFYDSMLRKYELR